MNKVFKPLVFGGLCVLLVTLIVMQLRVTENNDSTSSRQRILDGLKDQIIVLNDENDKLTNSLETVTSSLTEARTMAAQNDTESMQISELIKKYNTYIGNTDIYGQGVSIKYVPAKDENLDDVAKDLRYIVNELKNVGVEAISINDQRIVRDSSIEVVKNKIEINEEVLNAPYTIKAIGDSNMIYNGISRPGEIVDLLRASGVEISIELKDKVEISKKPEL